MNLYLISQTINNDWDTYDSAVVIADNEEEARTIHPQSGNYRNLKWSNMSWVPLTKLDKIKVEYLGEASAILVKGVVLASFNSG